MVLKQVYFEPVLRLDDCALEPADRRVHALDVLDHCVAGLEIRIAKVTPVGCPAAVRIALRFDQDRPGVGAEAEGGLALGLGYLPGEVQQLELAVARGLLAAIESEPFFANVIRGSAKDLKALAFAIVVSIRWYLKRSFARLFNVAFLQLVLRLILPFLLRCLMIYAFL